MNRGPGQGPSHNLGLPFIEAGELLVVCIEMLEELFKSINDFLVNPRAVLELNN